MNLHVIDAGNFKLDGGAMFGVVPKQLWSRKIPADDINLCSWKMRCLLIEDGKRLILVDTGMGDKQTEKWLSYYYRHGEGDLIKSIRAKGFHENDITDVILSHLHFDHAGGAVKWNSSKDKLELTFPNAHYWTHSSHWDWAMNPNLREAATFLDENLKPIEVLGHLKFIDKEADYFGSDFDFIYANGHTEKMIMPVVKFQDKKLIFIADTVPSHAHIHIPWVMGYDVRPLETMKEKVTLLDKIYKEKWLMFFDHDPFYDICTLEKTDKGYKPDYTGDLDEYL
ncbi:MAG: glyoxylase-like metal-dependent hydrolase (beta-lactamase superfamily II) [Arcticibacterium sp.]|jgi:glyoxylase-like metal-dependent hydrolase (beta-lactamase superfamily II)